MPSFEFSPALLGGSGFKAERLFKAAISAFCALTRPGRSEIAQLDDLALPLFPLVSAETRRFAAAALSECRQAPAGLVRRLADEPVAVSAPLLVRSRMLSDIDLIGLIGRHGLGHALAIARRRDLNPGIAEIVRALVAASGQAGDLPVEMEGSAEPAALPAVPQAGRAEQVRAELRAMMRPAASASGPQDMPAALDWECAAAAHPRLLSTAMTGQRALFQTAVADALDIGFAAACEIVDRVDGAPLVTALRALGISAGDAFLLFALSHPGGFSDAQTVRRFVDAFAAIPLEEARSRIERLRAQAAGPHAADNDAASDRPDGGRAALRAS